MGPFIADARSGLLTTAACLFAPGMPQLLAQYPNRDMLGIPSRAGGDYKPWMNGSTAWGGAVHGGFVLRDSRPGQLWDLGAKGQRGNAPWVHHAATWKDGHCKLGGVSAGANATSTLLVSTDADAGSRCLLDPSRFDKFDVSSPGGMSRYADPCLCPGHPTLSLSLLYAQMCAGLGYACRSTFLSLFGRVFARFYFYNVLAELDAEGEYFVDKTTATLYWKPAAPTAPAGAAGLAAVVSVLSTVVSAVNVTGVQLIGLSFLHARGDGLQVAGSTGVEVLGGTIANHGELGVNHRLTQRMLQRCSVRFAETSASR